MTLEGGENSTPTLTQEEVVLQMIELQKDINANSVLHPENNIAPQEISDYTEETKDKVHHTLNVLVVEDMEHITNLLHRKINELTEWTNFKIELTIVDNIVDSFALLKEENIKKENLNYDLTFLDHDLWDKIVKTDKFLEKIYSVWLREEFWKMYTTSSSGSSKKYMVEISKKNSDEFPIIECEKKDIIDHITDYIEQIKIIENELQKTEKELIKLELLYVGFPN